VWWRLLKFKRSYYEIIYDILRFCVKPRRISGIAQHCNLNTVNAKKYLEELTRKGLIKKIDDSYITSEKGFEYLKAFEEFYRLLFA